MPKTKPRKYDKVCINLKMIAKSLLYRKYGKVCKKLRKCGKVCQILRKYKNSAEMC